ncbi:efflux RND transporter periplasmic adaptor subunit [Sphingomonas adhaesiva]|uniref:efflux RND transporter periplasmic adaptor subunit n=1 Tax=Sphingomonas adhaesiva TaxID=28212 RepID=UPI002FFCA47F
MTIRSITAAAALLLLAGCGAADQAKRSAEHHDETGEHHDEGIVTLSAEQIAAAGIKLERPTVGGAATIEVPAVIEGDPAATQVVSASTGGRVVALTRNLGEPVTRGQTLAVIESREAAQLNGEVAAARARLSLAQFTLAREQRLFAQRVTPEQDLIAARTAAAEARIALRQAQGQVAAAGTGGAVGSNRLAIAAPIAGRVIARTAVLGQSVAPDAELYRIAALGSVSVALNLQPADAGRVPPGATITVRAPGRQATARVGFVSPALDQQTRLVPAIATLDNRAGAWRIGEAVTAAIRLAGGDAAGTIRVPLTAVQSIEGRRVVFVRTPAGFRAVPVTIGDTAGDSMIVRTGLTGREQIATVNSFTLKAELGKGEATHEDH